MLYIITAILCWPYWVAEIYTNFTYFNNTNNLFHTTRPLEPIFRSESDYLTIRSKSFPTHTNF